MRMSMRALNRIACAVAFVVAAAPTSYVCAEPSRAKLEDGRPHGLPLDATGHEKHNAGWKLALDNDLLSFVDRDFDYTGGLAVTFAGSRARDWWFSLDRIVGWLDPLVPASHENRRAMPLHSLQAV